MELIKLLYGYSHSESRNIKIYVDLCKHLLV